MLKSSLSLRDPFAEQQSSSGSGQPWQFGWAICFCSRCPQLHASLLKGKPSPAVQLALLRSPYMWEARGKLPSMVSKQRTAQQTEGSSMKQAQGKSSRVRDTELKQICSSQVGSGGGCTDLPKAWSKAKERLRLSVTSTDNAGMRLDTCSRGAEGSPVAPSRSKGCHQHQDRYQKL